MKRLSWERSPWRRSDDSDDETIEAAFAVPEIVAPFVIGGYTASLKTFDVLVIGYYGGRSLMQAMRMRNGFRPGWRVRFVALREDKMPKDVPREASD